jgi:EmrB/QacA subfamily drug resistance transporter
MTVESPPVADRPPRFTLLPGAAPAACPPHPDGGSADHAAEPHTDPAAAARCRRWTLATVCTATALLLFNVTAPNVALPDIAADLHLGFGAQQWVLSSYALVLASLLLAGGALGDRLGRKRLFLVGLGIFGVGSAIAAAAGSGGVLIAGRCVQGVGAAALFPAALALIAAEFEGAARARAIGVWGATVSVAIAAGPLFGGILVQAVSWRASFLVGLVLAVPTAAIARRHVRESRSPDAAGVDVPGTAALSTAMFLAVFALLEGNQAGWTSVTVLGAALISALALALFVAVEHRVAHPLIAPALMRNRNFLAATFVALVFAASGFGPVVFLTQLLIRVLGGSPIAAGAELLPFAVASFVVSLLAAQVAARVTVRVTLAGGLIVCAAGLLAMRGTGADGSWTHLIVGLTLWGAGSGLVNPTMTVAALAVVSPSQSGMASGVNNTARQLGIAAGIAALGALVQSRADAGLAKGHSFGQAYADAVDLMLLVAAGVAVGGAIVVVALIRTRRA